MIAFRMIALIGVFVFGLAIVLSNEVIAAPFTRLATSALPEQIGEQFDVVEVRRGRQVRRHRSGHRSSYGRVHRRNSYQGRRHIAVTTGPVTTGHVITDRVITAIIGDTGTTMAGFGIRRQSCYRRLFM